MRVFVVVDVSGVVVCASVAPSSADALCTLSSPSPANALCTPATLMSAHIAMAINNAVIVSKILADREELREFDSGNTSGLVVPN